MKTYNTLFVIPANDFMDGGGTSPWMGEGRTMQEQLSRAMQEAKAEAGTQWSPKSAYFWFNDILDSGLRRNTQSASRGRL